jgi:peptide/nickel transport system substrate-binding protein
MRHTRLLTVLVGTGLLLAACGSSTATTGASGSSGGVGGTIYIDNENGGPWVCGFNPWGGNGFLAVGFVYEPLYFVDEMETTSSGSNVTTPWLAAAYSWNSSDTQLTWTIRSGVKWDDGQPFTANDVVYTFNLMAKYAALDLNALMSANGGPITSVTLSGTSQVVMDFNTNGLPYFYYVADQTPIVPQHILQNVPASQLSGNSWVDLNPVGTGPYTVSKCQSNDITYTRNAHYWQSKPGDPVPKIQTLQYPAFETNDDANLVLDQGDAQWGAQYIPNINAAYVQGNSNRHYFFAGNEPNVGIYINTTKVPLAVRQAIAYAIDRSTVSQKGESGYEPPANQTGVETPIFNSWYDASADPEGYDPSKAISVLESAGYTMNSNKVMESAAGQQLTYSLQTVEGYTDWDASLQVIKQELAAVGIDISVVDEDNSSVLEPNLHDGNYTLAYYEQPAGGPTPYYELKDALDSNNINASTGTNYSQFNDSQTDTYISDYAQATTVSGEKQAIDGLSQIMVQDVPYVPVTEGVAWYQYDTTCVSGWPTQANPYALGAAWATPDNGVVLTHLSWTCGSGS